MPPFLGAMIWDSSLSIRGAQPEGFFLGGLRLVCYAGICNTGL